MLCQLMNPTERDEWIATADQHLDAAREIMRAKGDSLSTRADELATAEACKEAEELYLNRNGYRPDGDFKRTILNQSQGETRICVG